jgi:hypothetical protein
MRSPAKEGRVLTQPNASQKPLKTSISLVLHQTFISPNPKFNPHFSNIFKFSTPFIHPQSQTQPSILSPRISPSPSKGNYDTSHLGAWSWNEVIV